MDFKGQKILWVLLMVFMPLSLFAQNKISGVLVDASNNEPLIGVAIYLEKDKGVGTITDFDGVFELPLSDGKYNLVFNYLGFIDQKRTVNVTGDVDLGQIKMESSSVGLSEVSVVASFATDRKTPVAISNIPAAVIQEKLGNQEFPEVLKSTPSVYATKGAGGFGDSRVNIRGFNTSNIGVLINGVPVNDMENGKVYFSNWAGLNDVTSVMQVQRGLGASKLAISSVGGTMNILTKSADAQEGGSFYAGMGNDGYMKTNFNVSTGLMENGWALTLMGGAVKGDGYINGTSFEGYNYFANITKVINENHRLSFQIFGAPQTHDQRGNMHLISTFENKNENLPFSNTAGAKFNSEAGIRNGEEYGGGYGYNFYHKPQASLNHFWTINGTTTLSTSVYASVSQGGGRRLRGDKSSEVDYNRTDHKFNSMEWRTGDGYIDFDKMIEHNKEINGQSDFIIGNSINSHEWYGLLSTLNTVVDNVNLTFGLDSRYYRGEHYEQVDDLLGGQYYLDDNSVNRPTNTALKEGDIYSFHNDMQVVRNGIFGQAEFVMDQWSAFVSAASSYQNIRRIDYIQYEPGNQVSDWANFVDWSAKAGANYNINDHHNVFINGGYFIRSPFVSFVFDGYTNDILDETQYEKVMTFEGGYGFQTRTVNVKLGYYRTAWKDQGLRRSIGDQSFSLLGLNSLHQGVEFEGTYKPSKNFTIRAMASIGDWKYTDDVRFQQFDDENNLIGEFNAFVKDVSVGNSAQTTAALGVDYRFLNGFNIGVDGNYFGRNFADFDPSTRTGEDSKGVDAWQIPDAYLIDMNAGYNFNIASLRARISGRVNNLFDTVYITDAQDGQNHDWQSSPVYYGFGRTYSLGLKVNF
ncbi:TonB-dependent receptor [Saccharicrinis aurantiacus]|uniref:TonB-dependent receptor n=1 Tax=Saccharicrinis aurantiacus TaxID=1849719 RepID=UPI00094FDDF3|nr:TonB-dependent receptor [Saccharicrinis aurantiacus]